MTDGPELTLAFRRIRTILSLFRDARTLALRAYYYGRYIECISTHKIYNYVLVYKDLDLTDDERSEIEELLKGGNTNGEL